jgi:hypothetical protein
MLRAVFGYFGEPTDMLNLSTPAWAALELWRQVQVGFGTALVGAAVLICLAGGAWSMYRRSPVALALFVVPVMVTIAGAAAARGTMYPRFFFFTAGFIILFVVDGMERLAALASLPLRGKRQDRIITALFAALQLASAYSLRWNYRYPKQDFGGARAYVLENIRQGETAMVVGVTVRPLREYWELSWPAVKTARDITSARQDGPVWLVYSFPRYVASSYPDVWDLVQTDSELQVRLPGTLGDGDVLVCKFSGARPLSTDQEIR